MKRIFLISGATSYIFLGALLAVVLFASRSQGAASNKQSSVINAIDGLQEYAEDVQVSLVSIPEIPKTDWADVGMRNKEEIIVVGGTRDVGKVNVTAFENGVTGTYKQLATLPIGVNERTKYGELLSLLMSREKPAEAIVGGVHGAFLVGMGLLLSEDLPPHLSSFWFYDSVINLYRETRLADIQPTITALARRDTELFAVGDTNIYHRNSKRVWTTCEDFMTPTVEAKQCGATRGGYQQISDPPINQQYSKGTVKTEYEDERYKDTSHTRVPKVEGKEMTTLSDIACAPDGYCFIVGNPDVFLRYDGNEWTNLPLPSTLNSSIIWTAVSAVSKDHAWFVGDNHIVHWNGKILEESTAPFVFVQKLIQSRQGPLETIEQESIRLQDIVMVSLNEGYAVGLTGIVGREGTTQGHVLVWDGMTWKFAKMPDSVLALQAVAFDADAGIGYAVGREGTIVRIISAKGQYDHVFVENIRVLRNNPPYDHTFRGEKIYFGADPRIYSEQHIKEYTDSKFYKADDWKIVRADDPLLCEAQIIDTKKDSDHTLSATIEVLNDAGVSMVSEHVDQCVDEGVVPFGRRWRCAASFKPFKARESKMQCQITVTDSDGNKIKPILSPMIITASRVFPVFHDGSGFANIREQMQFFAEMTDSGLEDSVYAQIELPSSSYKVIYYEHPIVTVADAYNGCTAVLNPGINFSVKAHVPFNSLWDRFVFVSPTILNKYESCSGKKKGFAGGVTSFFSDAITVKQLPNNLMIAGHEFGHSYGGLCEEYSVEIWNIQNQRFAQGRVSCPNSLPQPCVDDYNRYLRAKHNGRIAQLRASILQPGLGLLGLRCVQGTSIMGDGDQYPKTDPPLQCPLGEC